MAAQICSRPLSCTPSLPTPTRMSAMLRYLWLLTAHCIFFMPSRLSICRPLCLQCPSWRSPFKLEFKHHFLFGALPGYPGRLRHLPPCSLTTDTCLIPLGTDTPGRHGAFSSQRQIPVAWNSSEHMGGGLVSISSLNKRASIIFVFRILGAFGIPPPLTITSRVCCRRQQVLLEPGPCLSEQGTGGDSEGRDDRSSPASVSRSAAEAALT